ncbi:hypothetical protein JOF41_005724 [Saccharothrix coeruleofusca]|nr:hypothetical protein [Saccharothrix coeruleofusca]MBP2339546.1 hypothetical protein [Saccharothrix coeruleofusca]
MTAPPAATRRSTASRTRGQRTSHGVSRPPPTWTSRCSRFFTTLASGTRMNEMRGPRPSGSARNATSPHLDSGTPRAVNHSAQLAAPPGGGCST